jgi:hypothetical protein
LRFAVLCRPYYHSLVAPQFGAQRIEPGCGCFVVAVEHLLSEFV